MQWFVDANIFVCKSHSEIARIQGHIITRNKGCGHIRNTFHRRSGAPVIYLAGRCQAGHINGFLEDCRGTRIGGHRVIRPVSARQRNPGDAYHLVHTSILVGKYGAGRADISGHRVTCNQSLRDGKITCNLGCNRTVICFITHCQVGEVQRLGSDGGGGGHAVAGAVVGQVSPSKRQCHVHRLGRASVFVSKITNSVYRQCITDDAIIRQLHCG